MAPDSTCWQLLVVSFPLAAAIANDFLGGASSSGTANTSELGA
jgi:hypothetical protein